MNSKRQLRWAAVSAGLLTLASAGLASEVTGKVLLSGQPVANVVISIENLKEEAPPDTAVYVVDHRNLDFVPHVLVIRSGARVRFENSDGMPCHIYSTSPAGNFALRSRDGKPMTITFDQPGIIVVRCAEHGRIYAYIIIRENPYFALTGPKGRYKLSNLSPGRYTLQAWYEGRVIETRTIEVGNKALKVDFTAARPEPAVDGQRLGLTPAILTGAAQDPQIPIPWRSEQ